MSGSGDITGLGSVTISHTIKETSCLGFENPDPTKNVNNLVTYRGGISTSDNNNRDPSFSFGVEHYTLDGKTSTTNGGYAFLRTKPNCPQSEIPLSLDVGIMCGINKFKNDKNSSYFNFTRSDNYMIGGIRTNFEKLEDVYVGVESRTRNGLRGTFTFGAKNSGDGRFVPSCGLGVSLDMDFI